jgi:YesN/AraC family two-component response regulator
MMDGITLVKELHTKYPSITPIIISGYQEFDFAKEALKSGVIDYLLKPVEPEALATLLASLAVQLEQVYYNAGVQLLKQIINSRPVAESQIKHFLGYNTVIPFLIRAGSLPGRYNNANIPPPDPVLFAASLAELKQLTYATDFEGLFDSVWDIIHDLYGDNETQPTTRNNGELIFNKIESYLNLNMAEPISLQSICEAFSISQPYLSRLFRKHRNLSFNEYLTKIRIDEACRLLNNHPEMLFKEIAEIVGYQDHHYFSRIFKLLTGQNPSEYKEKNIDSDSKNNNSNALYSN